MKYVDLERLFTGRIEDDSILPVKSLMRVFLVCINFGIELHKIKRRKYKKGIYHIKYINAFHSNFKKWMYRFNNSATEYLSNYMY